MNIPGGFDSLRACFAIRNFRFYFIGNIAHGLGVWVLRVTMGWLAWDLTQSTAWLGGIVLAEMAPTILLALIAGTVVDRVDYFKLLRACQAFSVFFAATLAVLTLTGVINIWLMFFLTLFRGVMLAFNRPSRMSLVYPLVGPDLMPSALAVSSIIFNGARFVGPAIGGFIIVGAGIGWAFVAASGLLCIYTIVLSLMRITIAPKKRESPSMLSETREGLAYILGHGGIRIQLTLLIVVGLFAKPVTDLLPGFAGQVFSSGADGLAMLLSAHGMGATVGAMWMAARPSGITGMTRITIASLLFMAGVLMLFVATDIFWLGILFSGLLGLGFITLSVANQTLIQAAVDPALRGRVISVYGLILQGIPALGALMLGGIAEHIGLRVPVFVGGLICLGAWFIAWRRRVSLTESLETVSARA
jgi:MFS family permease